MPCPARLAAGSGVNVGLSDPLLAFGLIDALLDVAHLKFWLAYAVLRRVDGAVAADRKTSDSGGIAVARSTPIVDLDDGIFDGPNPGCIR